MTPHNFGEHPQLASPQPDEDDLRLPSESGLSLAVALASAVRIEPALIRAARLRVRPILDVGAESALWYGPWAAHRGAQYMALRRPVQTYVRQRLVNELRTSADDDPIRLAGDVIRQAHDNISPVLALEEHVTWAALLAEAGIEPAAIQDADRWLQSALHAAVKEPHRRDGMRRWFSQAWQRLPQRARETSSALDLHEILSGPSGTSYYASGMLPSLSRRVADVVLPVRHDGSKLAFGDPVWPADGILVPDTQPRILHVTHDLRQWDEAIEVRVPRRGVAAAPASHVPMFVRTSHGQVYRVGAPGGSELIDRPQPHGSQRAPQLLGRRVADLGETDYVHFGIAPPLSLLAVSLPPRPAPNQPDTAHSRPPLLSPYQPALFDVGLRQAIQDQGLQEISGLIAVRGPQGSGRTCAAWHAMRESLPRWWVWAPAVIDRNRAILRALASDGVGSQTIVWLDDLDINLTEPASGEAVAEALLELLDDPGRRPILVLATLRQASAYEGSLGPAATALLRRSTIREVAHTDSVIHAGAVDKAPYPKPRPLSTLPELQPLTLGRESEIGRVLTTLERDQGDVPCAGIVGMAGMGTTTVAIQVAHAARARGRFDAGTLFIAFNNARRAPWSTLLRALNPRIDTRGQSPEQLRTLCAAQLMLIGDAARPVLMVLDNVTAAQLRDITAVSPSGFAVIATSHGFLATRPEHTIELKALDDDAAIQLLQHLLERRNPNDTRLRHNPDTARAIADICGHLPLALTMAAAQLATSPDLAAAALLESLNGQAVLEQSDSTGQTIRAIFDHALQTLSRPHRTVFCALSWLPGTSFSLQTARSILAEYGNVKELLAHMARYHLIAPAGTGRWQMHTLSQAYGRAISDGVLGSQRTAEVQSDIVDFFRIRAKESDALLRKGMQTTDTQRDQDRLGALEWLDAEYQNLIDLATECFDNGLHADGVAISMNIAQFLFQQGQFAALLALMERAYTWAEEKGNNDAKAAVLNNLAVSSAAGGDFQRARGVLLTVARLPYAQRQREDYLQMLSSLGAVLLRSEQTSEAIELLTDAISQHDHDRPTALVSLLCNLGAAFHQADDIPQALHTLERAALLADQYPISPADRAPLHRNLAEVLTDSDRLEEAYGHYTSALECLAQAGNRKAEALLHQDVANLMHQSGRIDESIGHIQQAQLIYHTLQDAASEAEACNTLSVILCERHRYNEALAQFLQARTLYQLTNNESQAAAVLHNIGNVLLLLQQYDEAIPALRNASAHLEALGDQHGEAQALHKLGRAFEKAGDLPRALEALHHSASRYQQLHLQQTYQPSVADQGEVPIGQIAAQAQLENNLLEESRSLRDDLLHLSHILDERGNDAEAHSALQTAVTLPNSP
ncbi:tetratricopeptide repeat protein [Streptomyces sp. NPDC057199]|uniref:tetratricopeptide repeat protein n=1 Tax=Streptomyces sp. NPDC057199 TaxID=3346047 RepID=UPI00363BEC65